MDYRDMFNKVIQKGKKLAEGDQPPEPTTYQSGPYKGRQIDNAHTEAADKLAISPSYQAQLDEAQRAKKAREALEKFKRDQGD